MHLRMSGDVRFETQDTPPALHDRLLVNFSDGLRLVFNDTRKFGRVWLVRDVKEILGNLGQSLLTSNSHQWKFFTTLARHPAAIKTIASGSIIPRWPGQHLHG